MVDIIKAAGGSRTGKNILSASAPSQVSGEALMRPYSEIGRAVGFLGEKIDEASVPLQQAAGASSVARDADGKITYGMRLELSQGDKAYNAAAKAGALAGYRNDAQRGLQELRLKHDGDPDGFKAASDSFVKEIGSSDRLLKPFVQQEASALAGQHLDGVMRDRHDRDLRRADQSLGARDKLLREELESLSEQGLTGSDAFRQKRQELDDLRGQRAANPKFNYSRELKDVDDRQLDGSLAATAVVGQARRHFEKTGDLAGAQRLAEEGLNAIPNGLSASEKYTYLSRIRSGLSGTAAARQAQGHEAKGRIMAARTDIEQGQDWNDNQIEALAAEGRKLGQREEARKLLITRDVKRWRNDNPGLTAAQEQDYWRGRLDHYEKEEAKEQAAPASYTGVMKTSDPVSTGLKPHERGLLNAIAVGESGGRYDIRYDGGAGSVFNPNGKHPSIMVPTKEGDVSSAAGRYQFTKTTWNRVMGDAPMTPENQDRAALKLARDDYRARTGSDLDADLQREGFSDRIQQALAPTWQALEGNRAKNSAVYSSSTQRAGNADDRARPEPAAYVKNDVTPIAGDDPVQLRKDAAALEKDNPDAARQMRVRADSAEGKASPSGATAIGPKLGSAAPKLYSEVPREILVEQQKRVNEEAKLVLDGFKSAFQTPGVVPTEKEVGDLNAYAKRVTDHALKRQIAEMVQVHGASEAVMAMPPKQREMFLAAGRAAQAEGKVDRVGRDIMREAERQATAQAKQIEEAPFKWAAAQQGHDSITRGKFIAASMPIDWSGNVAEQMQNRRYAAFYVQEKEGVGARALLGNDDAKGIDAALQSGDPAKIANVFTAFRVMNGDHLQATLSNKAIKDVLSSAINTGDAGKFTAVMTGLASLKAQNYNVFSDFADENVTKKVQEWESLIRMLPPEEMAKRLNRPDYGLSKEARDVITKDGDKKLEAFTVDQMIGGVDNRFFRFARGGAGSPNPSLDTSQPLPIEAQGNMSAFISDFRAVYKERLLALGGNHSAALTSTHELLQKQWSVSGVNRNMLMLHPPEKVYGTVNGDHSWITKQIETKLRKDLGIADSGAVQDGALDGLAVAGGSMPKYQLVPDKQTEMEARKAASEPRENGRDPATKVSYRLVYIDPKTGGYNMLNDRMAFDRNGASEPVLRDAMRKDQEQRVRGAEMVRDLQGGARRSDEAMRQTRGF